MEITEGKLKRIRNLPSFKNKTDEELIAYLKNKPDKPRKPRRSKNDTMEVVNITLDKDYNKRYAVKLRELVDEFGVDMNDANDKELVKILVRVSLQLEEADVKIREASNNDTKTLKELGEYQKSLINATTEIQDKLGITRKVRKEKQVDDIPQYLRMVRMKARDFWDRTTTPIICGKCEIELARYWLNFPELASTAAFELECYKCGEKVVYRK